MKKGCHKPICPYFFRNHNEIIGLENKEETRPHVSTLLINPSKLLEENISCFEHPAPAFKGEIFLEKAAKKRDLNIGKVRDSFSSRFKGAMSKIIETDVRDLEFELTETVEMKDLTQEIENAKAQTEEELSEK